MKGISTILIWGNCDSASGHGGAVAAFNQVNISIAGLLAGNSAGGDGGGVSVLDASKLLVGNGAALKDNRADGDGGCLYSGGAGAELCEYSSSKLVMSVSKVKFSGLKASYKHS
jgi:hypothetical protein